MQFGHNEEQRLFLDAARRYFDARGVREQDGFDREAWSEMARMGWLGAGFPEELGGADGGAAESAVLLEAAGGALRREPLIEQAVLAPSLVAEAAPALAAALIGGAAAIAPAWAEAASPPDAPTTWLGEDGRLMGQKIGVEAAADADAFVVTARDTSGRFVLVTIARGSPDIRIEPERRVDGRRVATVSFGGAAAEVLAEGETARRIWDAAFDHTLVALCAEAVGIADALLTRTLDYSRTRRQFGQPLVGFQALQHRFVDAKVALEEARSLTIMAARAQAEGARARATASSAAKVGVLKRCMHIAREAIQLHGGIGFTEELPVGAGFRRLKVLDLSYGDQAWHLSRVRGSPA